MALGMPELLIITIVGLLIVGGLVFLVALTLLSVKRAADRTSVEHDRQRAGDANQ